MWDRVMSAVTGAKVDYYMDNPALDDVLRYYKEGHKDGFEKWFNNQRQKDGFRKVAIAFLKMGAETNDKDLILYVLANSGIEIDSLMKEAELKPFLATYVNTIMDMELERQKPGNARKIEKLPYEKFFEEQINYQLFVKILSNAKERAEDDSAVFMGHEALLLLAVGKKKNDFLIEAFNTGNTDAIILLLDNDNVGLKIRKDTLFEHTLDKVLAGNENFNKALNELLKLDAVINEKAIDKVVSKIMAGEGAQKNTELLQRLIRKGAGVSKETIEKTMRGVIVKNGKNITFTDRNMELIGVFKGHISQDVFYKLMLDMQAVFEEQNKKAVHNFDSDIAVVGGLKLECVFKVRQVLENLLLKGPDKVDEVMSIVAHPQFRALNITADDLVDLYNAHSGELGKVRLIQKINSHLVLIKEPGKEIDAELQKAAPDEARLAMLVDLIEDQHINNPVRAGKTVAHLLAARRPQPKNIDALLEKIAKIEGGNLNIKDGDGQTVIDLCLQDNIEATKDGIKIGNLTSIAKISGSIDPSSLYGIIIAQKSLEAEQPGGVVAYLQALLGRGNSLELSMDSLVEGISSRIETISDEQFMELVSSGPFKKFVSGNPEARSKLLHQIVANNRFEKIFALRKAGFFAQLDGADLNLALTEACQKGNFSKAVELVANGADPNDKAEGGYSALYYAVASGSFDIVALLLADPRLEKDTLNEAYELLLAKSIAPSKDGNYVEIKNPHIIKMFQERGAKYLINHSYSSFANKAFKTLAMAVVIGLVPLALGPVLPLGLVAKTILSFSIAQIAKFAGDVVVAKRAFSDAYESMERYTATALSKDILNFDGRIMIGAFEVEGLGRVVFGKGLQNKLRNMHGYVNVDSGIFEYSEKLFNNDNPITYAKRVELLKALHQSYANYKAAYAKASIVNRAALEELRAELEATFAKVKTNTDVIIDPEYFEGFTADNVDALAYAVQNQQDFAKAFFHMYSAAKSGAIKVGLEQLYIMEQVAIKAKGKELPRIVRASGFIKKIISHKSLDQDLRNAERQNAIKLMYVTKAKEPGAFEAMTAALKDKVLDAAHPWRHEIAVAVGTMAGAANAAANIYAVHKAGSAPMLGLGTASSIVLYNYGSNIATCFSAVFGILKMGTNAIFNRKKLDKVCTQAIRDTEAVEIEIDGGGGQLKME